MNSTLIIIAAVAVALFVIGCIITKMYVKAPPSVAFILSGFRKTPRIIIAGGKIRVPFIERLDKLFLGQVTVDVKTALPVPTNDFIDVMVDAVCKVQVDPERIHDAAKNFLNMSENTMAASIKDTLEGNMREVVGAIDLRNLVTDRDKFSDQIAEKANADMNKLGLKILSCNIQNITDKNGLIQGLGADNTFRIKKDAAITKANAERDIEVAQAEAKKIANDTRVRTETEIAERNNELAIKKAELQVISDTKKAEADAAYEIQMQEQQKVVNVKTVDANIEKTKREQILSQERIKITQNELTAQVNAKADADKYQVQINAEAILEQQKRDAEAKAYYAEQEARAIRAKAEAELYAAQQLAEATKAKGLADAEAVKAVGIAEAKAIEAKGLAEAKSIEKKYEAWTKFGGDLAKVEILSKIMPDMAKNVAEPISAIDNINIYGGDGASSASKLSANVPTVIKQTLDTLKSVTGVDVAQFAQAKLNTQTHDKTIDDVEFDEVNE